jgi:deoxyribonuclease-4
MRLGAHMSISGGLEKAVVRGQEVGCEAIQIFTKNSNQWEAKPLTPTEVTTFRDACQAAGIGPVIAHSADLINLAAPDEALYEKSIQAFLDEMQRCELLSIPYLVIHLERFKEESGQSSRPSRAYRPGVHRHPRF